MKRGLEEGSTGKSSLKKAKNSSKGENAQARFMYSNVEIVKRHHAITIDDIRDLILHILADAPPPNWLRIDNVHMIQKVVALLVPGITPELLSLPAFPTSATANPNIPLSIPLLPPSSDTPIAPSTAANIPFIASTFSHACPTRAPGDQTRMHSVLSSFFTVPMSGEEKKRRQAQKLNSEAVIKDDPTRYLLTLEQMVENDYPIPSYMADVFEKPPDWIEIPEPKATGHEWGPPKVYAIDCEMCVTEDGKELTRVCVIDFASGIVVFDQLVKPSKPILDYLTRWSGITAEALAAVTTTLSQVQAIILRLLSPPTIKPNPFSLPSQSKSQPPPQLQAPTPILLGHSLESDLKALKICHPRCIDTALMYHHPRGRPLKPGLKWLTEKWCGRKIQTKGEGGHDPEEDARACLDLLKKKLAEGPGFGEFKTDHESIFERMGRASWRGGSVAGGIKTAVVDLGNPGVMHGSKADTALGCKTDDEVLAGLLNVIPSHQFTFGRFMALATILGWVTPKVTPDSLLVQDPLLEPTPSVLEPVISSLNSHLKTLQASLPAKTALIIFTGHSDPRRMSALNMRKSTFDTAYKSGKTPEELRKDGITWSAGDGRELEREVELARRGLLFLGVKQ